MSYIAAAEIQIPAPLQDVWNALIDPVSVKAYFYGTNLETDWSVGSPLFFRGEYNGTTYEDKGVVLSFEPCKELSFTYFSSMSGIEDKPENYHTVRYTLASKKGGTFLRVTQENIDKEERASHSSASWQHVLQALAKFVIGAQSHI